LTGSEKNSEKRGRWGGEGNKVTRSNNRVQPNHGGAAPGGETSWKNFFVWAAIRGEISQGQSGWDEARKPDSRGQTNPRVKKKRSKKILVFGGRKGPGSREIQRWQGSKVSTKFLKKKTIIKNLKRHLSEEGSTKIRKTGIEIAHNQIEGRLLTQHVSTFGEKPEGGDKGVVRINQGKIKLPGKKCAGHKGKTAIEKRKNRGAGSKTPARCRRSFKKKRLCPNGGRRIQVGTHKWRITSSKGGPI